MARQGGGEQRLGVGMQRLAGERARLAAFDDLAEIHHHDLVAHVRHGGEVVGDEEVGEAEPRLQIAQQVEDLGADRDVERRDRLVQHDQLGRQDQRAGDGDALALAAREFVREEIGRALRQADQVEQLQHAPADLGRVDLLVGDQRLGDDGADAHARIERGVGILEHRLDGFAVVPAAGRVQPGEIAALEQDGAAGGRLQPEHEFRRRGLAAARFAHHAQRLAALDGEGDAVDRAHDAALAAEDAATRREMLAEARRPGGRRSCHAAPHASRPWRSASSGGQPAARRAASRSTANSGGASARQRSNASGQRGAKEQPGGREARSGGWPSMAVRWSRLSVMRGIEPSSALV